MTKPLLGLAAMVKDEAPWVKSLGYLTSCLDVVRFLDTGSNDRTVAAIGDVFPPTPTCVDHAHFVDYGTSRNHLLELAKDDSEFQLLLSGDEHVLGIAHLRAFCERRRDAADTGAFYIRVRQGDVEYDSVRLIRPGRGWRYQGRVHEVLVHPLHSVASIQRVPDLVIVHEDRDPSRKRAGWVRDLEILRQELEADPKNTRAAFYYAQTLRCLGLHAQAAEAYQRRADMGGWDEEEYEARLSAVEALEADGQTPWVELEAMYLLAFQTRPWRAEPLYNVAAHHAAKGGHAAAYAYASMAAKIPYPRGDVLFVRREVYEWQAKAIVAKAAGWVGRSDEGEAYARELADRFPRNADFASYVKWYEARKRKENA